LTQKVLARSEKEIFDYLQKSGTTQDFQKILFSLYFQPQFVSLGYQNGRLTNLLIDFIKKALKNPNDLNSLYKSNHLDSVV
jgi:hypothetical protein